MAIYPWCFYQNSICKVKDAGLALNDLAALRGYAIFDFLRTYHKKLFLPDYYLERFFNSANALHIAPAINKKELESIIMQLLEHNDPVQYVGIRLIATGGPAEDSVTVSQPSFYILVEDLVQYPPTNYTEGIKLVTLEYQRPLPKVKTTNYQVALLHFPEAKKGGASEILYKSNGKLLECTRNNFFLIKDETIITPVEDIMQGCTRRFVIELARSQKIAVEERVILESELADADGAFITGTTRAITPVRQVDTVAFQPDMPVLAELIRAFHDRTESL